MEHKGVFLLVIAAAFVAVTSAQQERPIINPQAAGCFAEFGTNTNTTIHSSIRQHVELWQAIVLIVCFGAFGLLIVLIHRLIRTYIYYDAHLLDTFFDAGGDVNLSLVASALVARWAWPYIMTQGVNDVREFGLVGHFWFAAGTSIQLFLFAIVVAEIRIKAPGAKTFLQVIKARLGTAAHIVLMIFAFICMMMVTGIVMAEGTKMLTALTEDIDEEVIVIVLALAVVFMTVVGGVGGNIYVAYFGTAIMITVAVVFMSDVFYDPLKRDDQKLGDVDMIYQRVRCAYGGDSNEDDSALTFLSRDGMYRGIIYVISTFGLVFVDQSFWQIGATAKPTHGVWGFITGGLVWFALAFVASYAFGMAYLALSVEQGSHLVSDVVARDGHTTLYVGQELLQDTGSYLLFTVIMVAIITTVSAEVLATSSIIIYDIYQTYVSPFQPTPIPESKMALRMQRAIRNEEYLEYDKRCYVLKHVVVVSVTILIVPITLVLLAIDIDSYWLYIFTSILVSSCVLPISLAITWHRITQAGVVTGSLGGFGIALIVWLAYSSSYGDGLKEFRDSTIQNDHVIAAVACALGFGGLICVIVSLCCGGCDSDLNEEEEWEKVRQIDTVILPWSVKYAPEVGSKHMGQGRPHFYTVRRTFKASEICAYIFGVLLAVCFVLIWPALMLIMEVFDQDDFDIWTLAVLIVGIVALIYILLVPLTWEIINTCRQAYYNRMWTRTDHRQRLEEETPTPEPSFRGDDPEPRPPTPVPSARVSVSSHSSTSRSIFRSNSNRSKSRSRSSCSRSNSRSVSNSIGIASSIVPSAIPYISMVPSEHPDTWMVPPSGPNRSIRMVPSAVPDTRMIPPSVLNRSTIMVSSVIPDTRMVPPSVLNRSTRIVPSAIPNTGIVPSAIPNNSSIVTSAIPPCDEGNLLNDSLINTTMTTAPEQNWMLVKSRAPTGHSRWSWSQQPQPWGYAYSSIPVTFGPLHRIQPPIFTTGCKISHYFTGMPAWYNGNKNDAPFRIFFASTGNSVVSVTMGLPH